MSQPHLGPDDRRRSTRTRSAPRTSLTAGASVLLVVTIALAVMGCASSRSSGRTQVHVVQRGETVWSIAQSYGTTVRAVTRLNRLSDPDRIAIGQRLVVPVGRIDVAGMGPRVARRGDGPWLWPIDGHISSAFGRRGRRNHEGVDIVASRGTPIHAAAAGRVLYAGASGTGYGTMVVLEHDDQVSTVYAHNSRNYVRRGEWVAQGQVIAEVGATGRATGPHLHFEVRYRDIPQDPLLLLP
jgi:murein DD-endopeptidase MepM/ murein hydrolase activator NlpD